MRFLVTGGAGYIGSVLTPALLARGWQVTVLDTFADGNPYLAQCCSDPNFNPVRGDARVLEAPIGKDPDNRDHLVSNVKLEKTGGRPDFSIDGGIHELIKGIRMLRNARFGNV